jgi:hypothetical protein
VLTLLVIINRSIEGFESGKTYKSDKYYITKNGNTFLLNKNLDKLNKLASYVNNNPNYLIMSPDDEASFKSDPAETDPLFLQPIGRTNGLQLYKNPWGPPDPVMGVADNTMYFFTDNMYTKESSNPMKFEEYIIQQEPTPSIFTNKQIPMRSINMNKIFTNKQIQMVPKSKVIYPQFKWPIWNRR